MEDVKTEHTLLQPDIRRTMIVISNLKTGEHRKFAFSDLEAQVRDIGMPAGASAEVIDLLSTAKNLLLYSWYYYPFTITAALQAGVALERALKIRLNAKPRDTLAYLLSKAVKEGLLVDDGFPRWQLRNKAFARLHHFAEPAQNVSYVSLLLETFPDFRNTLAHGDRLVADIGFLQLDIAIEAIAQLFPSPAP